MDDPSQKEQEIRTAIKSYDEQRILQDDPEPNS